MSVKVKNEEERSFFNPFPENPHARTAKNPGENTCQRETKTKPQIKEKNLLADKELIKTFKDFFIGTLV